jgi:hypothetical protein
LLPEPLKVAVTGDHRMHVPAANGTGLQNNVYRKAQVLKQGDIVCTDLGNFPIARIQPRTAPTSVFEVTFTADRSVYVTTEPCSSMVAAFGAPHRMNSELQLRRHASSASASVPQFNFATDDECEDHEDHVSWRPA